MKITLVENIRPKGSSSKRERERAESEREMKGVGGPLLCIGDLLSDLGEGGKVEGEVEVAHEIPNSTSSSASVSHLHLPNLFQENYEHLNQAFSGTDHSWTTLTLKLCAALETANKLVQSSCSNVTVLSEKVGELEKTVRRADSVTAAAKEVHVCLDQKNKQPFSGS